ncbi:MAG: hypothetical protein ABIC36_03325 [bacterium]
MRPFLFMVILPHMLAGAVVGARSRNIATAFIFSIIVHFLIDALPHWDYLSKIDISSSIHILKIFIDFVLGCVLVWFLCRSHPRRLFILIAIFAALLPDCLEIIYYNFNVEWLGGLSWFHNLMHYSKDLPFKTGIWSVVIVCAVSVWMLFKDKSKQKIN